MQIRRQTSHLHFLGDWLLRAHWTGCGATLWPKLESIPSLQLFCIVQAPCGPQMQWEVGMRLMFVVGERRKQKQTFTHFSFSASFL